LLPSWNRAGGETDGTELVALVGFNAEDSHGFELDSSASQGSRAGFVGRSNTLTVGAEGGSIVAAFTGFPNLLLARRTANGAACSLTRFAAQSSAKFSRLVVVSGILVAYVITFSGGRVELCTGGRALWDTGGSVVIVANLSADACTVAVFIHVRFAAFGLAPFSAGTGGTLVDTRR
jgi:hypothetical protein